MQREKHLTTRQVADICGVNLNTIQNWARRNLINGFRTAGGHLRFRQPDVVDFLKRQGIPLPMELERHQPKVYCLCKDGDSGEALDKWLRKDFEAKVFSDAWEMAFAAGGEQPDLLVVDLSQDHESACGMLGALSANPKTAHVPVILLTTSGDDPSLICPEARSVALPRHGLQGAQIRRSAHQLLGA